MGGVSVGVGVLSLIAAGLIATIGNMQWPRLVVALVLTGMAGIMNGSVGPKVHDAVTRADSQVGRVVGQFTGVAIIGLIGLVAFVILAFWVYQGHIDMRTLGVAALVPPTVTMIPGTLGTIAVAVVGFVPWLMSSVIGFAFGIG